VEWSHPPHTHKHGTRTRLSHGPTHKKNPTNIQHVHDSSCSGRLPTPFCLLSYARSNALCTPAHTALYPPLLNPHTTRTTLQLSSTKETLDAVEAKLDAKLDASVATLSDAVKANDESCKADIEKLKADIKKQQEEADAAADNDCIPYVEIPNDDGDCVLLSRECKYVQHHTRNRCTLMLRDLSSHCLPFACIGPFSSVFPLHALGPLAYTFGLISGLTVWPFCCLNWPP
jgi:hypothetical protein